MAASQWVVDVTMENFQEIVVDGSRARPVVIDFWAEWCRPCKLLAPLLEKFAEEKAGGFLLVKVNVDENPDLAQAFQVEGIPAVFAVRDGQIANQFSGMIPEEELRAFIDELGTFTPAEPTALEVATELEARDPKAARDAYQAMIAAASDDPAARVGLARVLLATPGNEMEAASLLTGLDFGDFADEAQRLNAIVQLRALPHADADLATAKHANTNDSKLTLAHILAARGEYTAAMDVLIAIADDDRQLGRTSVREFMLKIFDVIGTRSVDADEYRRRLQNLLY